MSQCQRAWMTGGSAADVNNYFAGLEQERDDFMKYLAHIEAENGQEKCQEVYHHLVSAASKAKADLDRCGLGNSAYLAGLLHDMGKCTLAFQDYLKKGDLSKRGSVIHTFQGCRYVLESFHDKSDLEAIAASEIIAYAIGAHHGLFDCIDSAHGSGLKYRIERDGTGYDEAVKNFFSLGFSEAEIKELFSLAKQELGGVFNKISESYEDDNEFCFQTGMLTRLILSALIDGDRYDTANFKIGVPAASFPGSMAEIWAGRLRYAEEKLQEFPCETEIDKARRRISDICKEKAQMPCGIYRLNVPTGGGKTLSSLRYALAHAAAYNKRRIIFTSPLLSILEQNAAVIRQYINDDSMILEHHSNVVQTENKTDELDEKELWSQSWDAPVIITTMVQLLNTLFDGRTSSIRRFQSLCSSIIIIDEVQTVPSKLITMFNMAIRFLSEYCGATVVLCSATQPRFDLAAHPLKCIPPDIVPYSKDIWAAFEQTKIEPLESARLEDIPAAITSEMDEAESLLVICNKKDEAAYLFAHTKSREWTSFHLSAGMCMHHRIKTVDRLKAALKDKEKVLCISTQVIEAGVDISFSKVIRFTAGMDSVVQAAGRCNRNGEAGKTRPVYILNCSDERLGKLEDIRLGKTASTELLDRFQHVPEEFDHQLSSEKAISYYYKTLYREMKANAQDYYSAKVGTTLFDLLSQNRKYIVNSKDCDDFCLWQAFKTAGQIFSVFDENTTDIIVPYESGEELISLLCSEKALYDERFREALIKEAAPYTVSVYEYQRKQLEASGALASICDGNALAVLPGFYDEAMGLMPEANTQSFLEV